MKNVIVNLGIAYGYSCSGESHGTEDKLAIEVEDTIGNEIQKLLLESSPLDQDKIATLIDNGCSFLMPIVEKIDKELKVQDALYWIKESREDYDEYCTASFENYVVNALADGRWLPSKASDGERRDFDDMRMEFRDWLDNQPLEEQIEAYGLQLSDDYNKEYEIISVE